MTLATRPLAERIRPGNLEEYRGQAHLVGPEGVLRKMIASENISSFILWGPPGVGKTTLAKIIAGQLNRHFHTLSAVHSGVKEVREVIAKAKKQKVFYTPSPILFIDEIHRFSKSQQDSLLSAVETGIVVLIGATTENPSFEVISPLLSRCQVYVLNPLNDEDLGHLLEYAAKKDAGLKSRPVTFAQKDALIKFSGGDGRKLLNILELVVNAQPEGEVVVTNEMVITEIQENPSLYDKDGEQHYDMASAFIKSIRGGDPDAAVYWMARMLAGGEDPKFVARRLVISASEDIGLANPNALLLATSCFQAVTQVGMPEARIILSETAIYLATSPKSNAAYLAINKAMALVKKTGNLPVPMHLRNAPTQLMKEMGYSKGYKYPHDFPGNFTPQQYLPDAVQHERLYAPQDTPAETTIRDRLLYWWKQRYKKK